MNKKNLKARIGGVPEHFNLPWRLAIESGAIADLGMNASWQDFPSGTGSMVQAFADDQVDVAMLLTEGAIKAKAQGATFDIIGFYTNTPLLWGIHVPAHSNLHTLSDLEHAHYAISRFGSGSNLMAYLLASQQNQTLTKDSFKIISNLAGARDLFKGGGDYAFLWEKFMTQPMVDSGEFRRIGEIPTPWPCFVICIKPSFYQAQKESIDAMLQCVFDTAQELKASPLAAKLIAARYQLKIQAVKEWLKTVDWASTLELNPGQISKTKATLKSLDLI